MASLEALSQCAIAINAHKGPVCLVCASPPSLSPSTMETSTNSSSKSCSPPMVMPHRPNKRSLDEDGGDASCKLRAVHTGQAKEQIMSLEEDNLMLKEAIRLDKLTLRKAMECFDAAKIQNDVRMIRALPMSFADSVFGGPFVASRAIDAGQDRP
ncbi:hypothetical protein DFH06DRAFT_1131339 [Mycena polygramma]|nr:hypothetical protein DFH06DRAFT_1131339 [Mycena polygramma]